MHSVRYLAMLLVSLCLLPSGCGGQSPRPQPAAVLMTRSPIVPAAPESVVIAVVIFQTGSAAAPFGIPASNGAQVIINALNRGDAPPPYDTPGIGGVPIQVIYYDEAGGPEKQAENLRQLYQDGQADLVIGYISSGDCLAAAPVAEAMKKLLVVFDCGTSRLFEERGYHYVFRTNAHQAIDSIGGARYLATERPDVRRVGGINQNYAWGQDSWSHFRDTLAVVQPDIQIVSEQFPKLGSGDYQAELDDLNQAQAQVIHSSFWGEDLSNLVAQARTQGVLEHASLLLSVGEYALPELGSQIPKGTMIGAHGPHGIMAPPGELNDWLNRIYRQEFNTRPVYPVYHMAQAILGVKLAYETAARQANHWPNLEQVIKVFEYLDYPTPSGQVQLALGGGHQAVEPAVFGTVGEADTGAAEVRVVDLVVYPVGCVNPPDGVPTEQWIKDGFPDNNCPQP